MRNKIYISLLLFLSINCDPMDGKLAIANESKDTIFITLSADGIIKENPIKFANGDTLWSHIRYTLPGKEDHPLSFGSNSWENTINKKYKDSTLTVFIFDKKLLKTVTEDSLLKHQLCSKKFSFKVKDLEKLKWRVEYK
jgi:hypothetical protein